MSFFDRGLVALAPRALDALGRHRQGLRQATMIGARGLKKRPAGCGGGRRGRVCPGWLSDRIGRLHTLRLMGGASILAFLVLPHIGGVLALYGLVFVVYYCYGTQLSVYASTTGDFFGTKNLGGNYGLLFTAWGVARIIGPIIAGRLFDIFGN